MNQVVEDVNTVFTCTVSAKPLAAVFSNSKSKSPGIITPFFIQVDDTELITMVAVAEKPKDMTEKYGYNICFPALVENSDLDADTFVCVRTEDAVGAEGAYEALKALGDEPVELRIETTGDNATITIGEGVLDILLDGTNIEEALPHPDDYEEGNEDLGLRWDPEETLISVVMFYSEYYPGYYITTTLKNHDDPDELFKVRRFIDKNTTPEIEGDSFMAESARRVLKKGAKIKAVPAVEGSQPKTPKPKPAGKTTAVKAEYRDGRLEKAGVDSTVIRKAVEDIDAYDVTEDHVREVVPGMYAETTTAKKAEDTPAADNKAVSGSAGVKEKGSKRRSRSEVRLDNIEEAKALLYSEQDSEDVCDGILSSAIAIVEHHGREVVIPDGAAEQSLEGTLEKALDTTDRLRQYIQHAKATADVPDAPVETPEAFRKRAIALLISEVG